MLEEMALNHGSWEISDYYGNQVIQGSGNFGNQSLQSFFIENDISNLEEDRNEWRIIDLPLS